MRLGAIAGVLACAHAWAADVAVNTSADRHPISALIYGINHGSDAQAARIGATLRRLGGNGWTRYNWEVSTTNEGGDLNYFRNLYLPAPDGGVAPDYADRFIAGAQSAGAQPLIEIGMIGYVAKPGSSAGVPYTCGFKVSLYGPQGSTSPFDADCGNGRGPGDAGFITGNNPLDTSVAIDAGFVTGWLQHLVATHGSATDGGVRLFNLGNQPALWHETHQDIHPQRSSYSELQRLFRDYSTAVKDVDPNAQTLGPAAWGWLEYWDSANHDAADAGLDFTSFYLRQAQAHSVTSGRRMLDYLDFHVYPQGVGVALGTTDLATNALRLRSTRVLWDPTYTVESWELCCPPTEQQIINRMKGWVAAEYPGTKISFSSYYWGALDHVNGALAQTELLGIFGREGVDLAALEPPLPDGQIGEDAFKLFRNFDGAGAKFGDTSVRATSTDPNLLSSYAAYDLAGHVTVVLINKDPGAPQTVNVTFSGVNGSGSWRAYGFGSLGRLASAGAGSITTGVLSVTVQAYSALLVEYTPTGGVPADAGFPEQDAGTDAGVDAGTDGGAGGGGGSGGGGGGTAGGSGGGGTAGGSGGGGTAGGSGGGGTAGGSGGGGTAGGSGGGGTAGGSGGGGTAGGSGGGGGGTAGGAGGGGGQGGSATDGGMGGGGQMLESCNCQTVDGTLFLWALSGLALLRRRRD